MKHMCTIGEQTKGKKLKTTKGVKDTYQEYFIERIQKFTRNLRGNGRDKQRKINNFVGTLPANTNNPVWKIKGMYDFLLSWLFY